MSEFKDLKSNHPMSEIVDRLDLKRPGQTGNYRCPVHGKDERPSLSIFGEGSWFCHVCGKNLQDIEGKKISHDQIGLVQFVKQISLKEAVKWIDPEFQFGNTKNVDIERLKDKKYHPSLNSDYTVENYLKLHFLEENFCRRNGVYKGKVLTGKYQGDPAIIFPANNDKKRYRIFSGDKWYADYGSHKILFKTTGAEYENTAFLFAGEGKALLFSQIMGFKAYGTQGEKSFKKEWAEELSNYKEVIYFPDRDKTGLEAVDMIAKYIPAEKLKIVQYPPDWHNDSGKDFTDYIGHLEFNKNPDLQTAIIELFINAKSYTQPEQIKSSVNNGDLIEIEVGKDEDGKPKTKLVPRPQTFKEVGALRIKEREDENKAPSTGLIELDEKIAGWIPGHLITFTGQTNVGKTTTAANFAYRSCISGGRVLYLALEPDTMIAELIASIKSGKNLFRPKSSPDEFATMTQVDDLLADIPGLKIVREGMDSFEAMKGILKYELETAGNQYDLVIIDHIGYFVTDPRNYIAAQANLLKDLARFAKDFRTCILSIAHLNKASGKKKENLSMDDISGSAAFKQDSTEVLILTRDNSVSNDKGIKLPSNTGKLTVHKTKISGGHGFVKVHFDNETGTVLDDIGIAQLEEKLTAGNLAEEITEEELDFSID